MSGVAFGATSVPVRKPLLLQCHGAPVYRAMIDDHRERHQTYADRHGYDYIVEEFRPGVDPFYARIEVILEKIELDQWSHIFWLDADCVVVDLSRDMRETLADGSSYGLTIHPFNVTAFRDQRFYFHAGQLYFRSDDLARRFVQAILDRRSDFDNDQRCINNLLMEPNDFQRGLRILYQNWNNTTHDERPDRMIVAAFHGSPGTLESRRQRMLLKAKEYPYKMDSQFLTEVERIPRLATDPFGWLYYGLATGLRPGVIVECGLWHGYTTAFLARAAKDMHIPFVAVDNFSLGATPQDVARNLDRCGVADAVTLIRHDSAAALRALADEHQGKVALVIIDTMHTYEMVMSEIGACWPWMADGSIIGSHDAQHSEYPGVNQALREWREKTDCGAFWFGISGGFGALQKMESAPRLLWPHEYMAGERA